SQRLKHLDINETHILIEVSSSIKYETVATPATRASMVSDNGVNIDDVLDNMAA
ncbi:hypothetical protein KI387_039587, partial [Taxus chinensis]